MNNFENHFFFSNKMRKPKRSPVKLIIAPLLYKFVDIFNVMSRFDADFTKNPVVHDTAFDEEPQIGSKRQHKYNKRAVIIYLFINSFIYLNR